MPKFPFIETFQLTRSDGTDLYGQTVKGEVRTFDGATIEFIEAEILSSTGADVAASRGRVGDETIAGKIIAPLGTDIKRTDIIGMHGEDLKVDSVRTRVDLRSRPTHLEILLIRTVE